MWIVNHLKLSLTKPREANEINVALNKISFQIIIMLNLLMDQAIVK